MGIRIAYQFYIIYYSALLTYHYSTETTGYSLKNVNKHEGALLLLKSSSNEI